MRYKNNVFLSLCLFVVFAYFNESMASNQPVQRGAGSVEKSDVAEAMVMLAQNQKNNTLESNVHDPRVLALRKLGTDWRSSKRCELVYQYCDAVRKYAERKKDIPFLAEVLYQVALTYHHQAKYEDAWALFASILRMPNIAQSTRARVSLFLPSLPREHQVSQSTKKHPQLQRTTRYDDLRDFSGYWLSK